MIINKELFTSLLEQTINLDNLDDIKKNMDDIKSNLNGFKMDKIGLLNISSNGGTIHLDNKYITSEIEQILETKTIERTKYYLQRLKKGISEVKTSKINDLNLNRWKEYDDILTESLWILEKRDKSGAHNGSYWGNFIPQIPNQFLRRYTKQGEWILDPFLGSGTSLIEAKRLGRNGIGVELLASVVSSANNNIEKEKNTHNVRTEIICGDSSSLDFKEELYNKGISAVQFLIMHPPYWDIIKFSDNAKDLSNAKTLQEFLNTFGKVVDSTYPILEKGRYFAVVIGDKL